MTAPHDRHPELDALALVEALDRNDGDAVLAILRVNRRWPDVAELFTAVAQLARIAAQSASVGLDGAGGYDRAGSARVLPFTGRQRARLLQQTDGVESWPWWRRDDDAEGDDT